MSTRRSSASQTTGISFLLPRDFVDNSTTIKLTLPKSSFWFMSLKDILKVIGVLLVPLMLGVVTLTLTIQNTKDAKENRAKDLDIAQRQREQTAYLAEEERQNKRLAEYLNAISSLMFSNQTLDPLLRAKTLSVLRQLDVQRKREVILFLYEAKLIRTDMNSGIPIISLQDINLDNIDFNDLRSPYTQLTSNFYYHTHMSLRGVSLRNASFQRRTIYGSDLAQTDCTHADFSSADLFEIDFSYAKLIECNFENARFDSANLQNANLSQSNITDEQLATALTYQGAILPNGTIAKNKNLLINDDCISGHSKNLSGTHWMIINGSQQADSRFCDGNSKMCINGICSFDDELDTTNEKSTYSVDIEVLFLLTAAYGDAWATNILHFHLATRGTQYALSKDRIEIFGRFLTRGDAWFTMGSVWTWGILGRVIDRGVHVWYTHLFSPDRLRALAMDVTNTSTAIALRDYADRLEHRHETPPLVGNRHFYTSDFQVHRRANWTIALKMHSVRTIATECLNGENLKGEHIGDGVLNLYTRDAQYGNGEEYENIFALLDWQAINGITVEADIPLLPCHSQFSMRKTTFVGGVSDGNYGAAMMDTATHNLTAKRTWHFYDDFIVALADDIQDNTSALLQTAVVSRLLPPASTAAGQLIVQWSNGTKMVLADGVYSFPPSEPRLLWFHADNTAWMVLDDYAALTIDCRNKSGNVNQLGPWNFEMQGRLLTATIVHGRGPTTEPLSYKYTIMPNVTVDAVPALWNRRTS
ncbi:unnamed protein product [Rotaria sordida]|uniref:Polysaccharide lyase family 8 central domain-containing protein n=1 Tax=Rotaria sordida TaxID=392033 RepID=A0A819LN82_9BILA|nr:unnamed protein product [Rotaria sordida]